MTKDNLPEMDLLGILYQALRAQCGLLVQVSNFDLVRKRMYNVRAEANDPSLLNLIIKASIIEGGNMVIIRANSNQAGA